MFAEVCARMFCKSTNTFQVVRWFPVSAESFEDVPCAMDIIEGPVRYRRRKKWKSRWAVLRRVNPASDVLNLVLYQDQVSARSRQKEKAFISLDSFCGLHLLNKLDKHFNIIIAITANEVIRLSLATIEERSEWVTHLERHFGKEQSFDGIIPHKQKLKSGEATLRFYKTFFSLTRKDNYRHIGKWYFVDLPHYGAVYGAFAFEVKEGPAGSNMYYFATKHGPELHNLFDGVCKGTEVGESNYVEPSELDRTPQRSVSQPESESASKPNVFKRAWQRMSQRRTRKKIPRSQSEPGVGITKLDDKKGFKSRELPARPEDGDENETESKPETQGRDQDADASAKDRRMTTPEGYELMDDDVPDAMMIRRKVRASRTSETSADSTVISRPSVLEKPAIEEESDEHDGYVMVDGMDVEEIMKEAEKRVLEESQKEREKETEEAAKSPTTASNTVGENIPEPASSPITTDPSNSNQNEDVSSSEKNEDDPKQDKESSVIDDKQSDRSSDGYDNIVDPLDVITKACSENTVASKSPPKTPVRPKSLEAKQELLVINPGRSRRGIKNPPPEIILPNDIPSPENPYVNSPPSTSVDYVNVPGSRGINNGIRSRSKTTNIKSSGMKNLNPYEKYDGNDDSIYHSVESLLPGNPAYQNIRVESNRSHSFDSIPGHAYSNLPGHSVNGQAYQNIGPRGTQAYVNVTPRKKRFQKNQNTHQLNYIQVEGTDGTGAVSGLPSFSPPLEQQNSAGKSSSSEYTWIDESRTRLLKETARMHSDLRKENLPKVAKKY